MFVIHFIPFSPAPGGGAGSSTSPWSSTGSSEGWWRWLRGAPPCRCGPASLSECSPASSTTACPTSPSASCKSNENAPSYS
eukprot:1185259-Prorocentrum_minimum.AAC.1